MVVRRNNLTGYNPLREMEELERRMFAGPYGFFSGARDTFRTDVKDAGAAYELSADLPGFDKEEIHIDINGDVLTVSAEHCESNEEKEDDGRYLCRERCYGAYRRSFRLDGINTEAIAAKYENGVLKLTLPKVEEKVPASRRLTIE